MSLYRRVLALLAASLLLLTACAPASSLDDVLSKYGMAGKNAEEIIEHLETMDPQDRPDDLLVSVQADQLVIQEQPDGTEHTMPLPQDKFYLSIAPYKEQTHDCFYHALTSCLGEITDTEFFVHIRDTETGENYVNDHYRTNPNGFVGFWLPRDRNVEMKLSTHADHGLESPKVQLSTASDAPTCITDVKLNPIIYVEEK
ncbi:CueP family metal-binding protein [Micrococcoides hystricis]|uniref:CueP family metal-binding protein n=1 Tax=Micrococcoides hystricis TaxID=1572761 RepID=A0ABV6P959_9MICC